MFRRTQVQRWSRALAFAGVALSFLLYASGGFDAQVLGAEIRAHDPLRPLLAAALAFTVYVLAGGDLASPLRLFRDGQPTRIARRLYGLLPSPGVAASILAAVVFVTAVIYGSKAVGGADSYGYVSQAHLWTEGDLKVHMPFIEDVPWPRAISSFTPLGYLPMSDHQKVTGDDRWAIVPIFSPGLPLLMAFAKVVAGYQAMFLVVPALAGVLILATYGIGCRLSSPPVALIAAYLVATSPAVLFLMMPTMSDTAVAGIWAAAFYFLLGGTKKSAAAAGLLSAVAVLVRPNLAPLAAIMGLYYVIQWRSRDTRREAIVQAAIYALASMPGALVVALMNTHLYGSPLRSGYGDIDRYFSLSFVVPNFQNYLIWLFESQTALAFVGLTAILLPIRRLWPDVRNRAALMIASLFVLAIWAQYLVYTVFDVWWYLRFLLPAWPFVMLGTASVLVALARWRPKIMTPVVIAILVVVGGVQLRFAEEHSVFDLWAGERRFVVGARMARELTERNSVIISGQHTGSLRYYASRMTMHYDGLDRAWGDRAVEWFGERGVRVYALLEDWEVDLMRQEFAGQRIASALDLPPLGEYRNPGTLYLFDLSNDRPMTAAPHEVTGTYNDIWAAPKAPNPRLVVEPGGMERRHFLAAVSMAGRSATPGPPPVV